MNLGLIRTIVACELRQHVRDPVTLVAMVGMPLVVYPILGVAGGKLASGVLAAGEAEVHSVVVEGAPEALVLPANLRLVGSADAETAVANGSAKAGVALGGAHADLYYSGKEKASRDAADRLEEAVMARARARAEREVVATDTLSPAEAVRAKAAKVVPALLLFTMLTGGLYTALDLVTGEKERGTMETTLTTAAPRSALVVAKYLCVLLFSVVGVLCSVVSGFLTARWVAGVEISVGTAALGAILLLPACAIVSAVLVAAAAWVPDFKAGQVYTLPLLLVPLALGGVAAAPGVALTPATALFPLANLALSLRELILGRAPPLPLAITFVTTAALAVGAVRWATAQLGREDVILGTRGAGQRRLRGDYRLDAWTLWVFGGLGLWLVALPLQAMDLRWGMLATQAGMILPLALLAPGFVGLPTRECLRLNLPNPRGWLEGVAVGCATPVLGLGATYLQSLIFPEPSSELADALTSAGSLWVSVPLFAILPGFCEEMFFRGAFFGFYSTKARPVVSVLVTALAFGIFHVELYRIFPTAVIGAALGFLSVRHRSVLPGMLAHALNNSIALVALSA